MNSAGVAIKLLSVIAIDAMVKVLRTITSKTTKIMRPLMRKRLRGSTDSKKGSFMIVVALRPPEVDRKKNTGSPRGNLLKTT